MFRSFLYLALLIGLSILFIWHSTQIGNCLPEYITTMLSLQIAHLCLYLGFAIFKNKVRSGYKTFVFYRFLSFLIVLIIIFIIIFLYLSKNFRSLVMSSNNCHSICTKTKNYINSFQIYPSYSNKRNFYVSCSFLNIIYPY